MSELRRNAAERRAESFGNRRVSHVDKASRLFRFAGELFGTAAKERAKTQQLEVRRRLQASRAVGVGFGERDDYGPDNSWETQDALTYTPSPEYYKTHRSS